MLASTLVAVREESAGAWPRVGNLTSCQPRRSLSYRINTTSPWPQSQSQLYAMFNGAAQYLNSNYKDYYGTSWVQSSMPQNNTGGIPIEMMDIAPTSAKILCDTGGNPYIIYMSPSLMSLPSSQITSVTAHEMLHTHGLSHDGASNNLMGQTPGLGTQGSNPVISTCTGFDQYPSGTAQDSSQAAYRMTGNGGGAMLAANIGFEDTAGLQYSFWNASGPADIQTWAPHNGSRYARLFNYNTYLEQGLTLTDHWPNFQLSYAYRGSSHGYVGWEIYQRYVTYPPGGCSLNSFPWAHGRQMNQPQFGGWFLAAGAWGPTHPYYSGNGAQWYGAGIVPISMPTYWLGSQFAVRIYNQLNGGHLNVDNVILWQTHS